MARTNRTRFALLGMLAQGERSGYDMKKDFERRMSHFWAESAGQIYPTLRKLRADGLVHEAGRARGPRRRKLYALTPAGRSQLEAWLREPPQREVVRNEILLKLYFGTELGVETAIAHVERFEAEQRSLLELFEHFEGEIGRQARSRKQELFWRITLSSGLHVLRARIAWCEESRRKLEHWRRNESRDGRSDR